MATQDLLIGDYCSCTLSGVLAHLGQAHPPPPIQTLGIVMTKATSGEPPPPQPTSPSYIDDCTDHMPKDMRPDTVITSHLGKAHPPPPLR